MFRPFRLNWRARKPGSKNYDSREREDCPADIGRGERRERGGTAVLQRDSVGARYRVLREVVRKSKGRTITIFAQGTTGSIADHLPFECGVFKTVEMDHDIILFPVTIHYREDSKIAWTSDKILIDNLINICAQKRIHVKVTVHEQISIDDYHDKTIDEICANAQDKVFTKLKSDY